MLLIILYEIAAYLIPLLLISYGVFIISVMPAPRSKGLIVKMVLCIVAGLLVIHGTFWASAIQTYGKRERRHQYNGVYIGLKPKDTVILFEDSIYIAHYLPKDTTKVASTYAMSQDSITMFTKDWSKAGYRENVMHYFKHVPFDSKMSGEIKVASFETPVKDQLSDDKHPEAYYHLALNGDTLILNSGNNKKVFFKYIKMPIQQHEQPAATK
ncbi:hypothetical protein BDD43_2476 [Mucilaginibacter gracilis]|uniref:Uncharacterized protein n=1 Tax=Mucilaginibacter gracilis TaxID=423350 RepID=A0A495J017_9SPHI|nr:hypothetical protein [Mucilaginibacter gracilis]RKR82300.1 hypothetical protein BDD43_2476 [Mucilaginibacter gracilis]